MSVQIWEDNHVKIKSKIAEEEEKGCPNISESNAIAQHDLFLLFVMANIGVWT